jgi:hypothetical protein
VTLVVADYNVTIQPTSATVVAGQPASYTLMLVPANGTTANAVMFTVTGLPANTTATFSPSPNFQAGTGPQTVTLSLATTAHSAAFSPYVPRTRWPHSPSLDWVGLGISFLALGFLALGVRARRLTPQLLLIGLLLIAIGLTACGGSGGAASPSVQLNPATGTPAGTYPSIVVTATSGSASINTTVTLIVM